MLKSTFNRTQEPWFIYLHFIYSLFFLLKGEIVRIIRLGLRNFHYDSVIMVRNSILLEVKGKVKCDDKRLENILLSA